METHQQINQDSGNTEYFTPVEIVEAARMLLVRIDLDPASCELANLRVKATKIYKKEDDGLKQQWAGRVWMNHPFEKYKNHLWINKLVHHYEQSDITEACCICYASTSERWFWPLLDYPQCFIRGRTNYFLPDGTVKKGVTKGSVVTYLGARYREFAKCFESIGGIKIPYTDSLTPNPTEEM